MDQVILTVKRVVTEVLPNGTVMETTFIEKYICQVAETLQCVAMALT